MQEKISHFGEREQANKNVLLTVKCTSAAAAVVVANLLRYKNGFRLWSKSENLAEELC